MKKILIFTILILTIIPFTNAANDFAYNRLYSDAQEININQTNIYQNITVNGSDLTLDSLSDVDVPSPSDGQSLVWDNSVMKWVAEFIISRWNVDISGGYLYNDSDTLYFNETKLNETIVQVAGTATDNTYDIYFNSSKKSIILYNLTDSDSSIITVHTVPGQKIIYGETFE